MYRINAANITHARSLVRDYMKDGYEIYYEDNKRFELRNKEFGYILITF